MDSSHFSESDFTTASHCTEHYESELGCTDYVAASLNGLVTTGKDQCTVCCELYSVIFLITNGNLIIIACYA
jgi:hypothetical protein